MQLLSASSRDVAKAAAWSSSFQASLIRSVHIDGFLSDDVVGAVSAFLLKEARFSPVYGVHSVPGHATDAATWEDTPEQDRLFFNEMLDGTSTHSPSKNLLKFLQLRHYLSSVDFCELISEWTQLSLPSAVAPRVHRLGQTHYLHAHHDRTKSRRVAYILYLSPGWQADFGGQLTIVSDDGEKTNIVPRYNSLLLFDVYAQQEHFIAPILPAAGRRLRLTMSGWLNCDHLPS